MSGGMANRLGRGCSDVGYIVEGGEGADNDRGYRN
jgi:hypothetical protein